MMTQYARGRGIKLAASGHRHPQKERHCRDRAARTDSEMTRAGGDCYRLIRLSATAGIRELVDQAAFETRPTARSSKAAPLGSDGVGRQRRVSAGRAALAALIEAAKAAGLHKLTSRVFPENAGSRALLKALGFEEIGIHRVSSKLPVPARRLQPPPPLWSDRHRSQRGSSNSAPCAWCIRCVGAARRSAASGWGSYPWSDRAGGDHRFHGFARRR